MTTVALTTAEVLELPATVDVPTAGLAFGLSRATSYRKAKSGELPFQVIPVGRRLVVTRAALMAALGIKDTAPNGA